MKTLVATYDNLVLAEGALRSLRSAGVPRDHMNLIASVEDEDVRPYFDEDGQFLAELREDDPDYRQDKRGSVLAVGSILATMGLLAIPALGPLLAAGPLASSVIGAGASAGSHGIEQLFTDVGVPASEIELYTEALRRGHVVLLVSAERGEVDSIAGMLALYGAIDLDRLESRWAHERAREHEHAAAVDAEAELPVITGDTADPRV